VVVVVDLAVILALGAWVCLDQAASLTVAAALLLLGLALLALLWVEARLADRRARNAKADAAIDAFLRERSEGARRTREVHGLTVSQLLDLVDIELDLDADEDLRSRIDELNDKFPQT
jgi:hypothetical protein